MNLVGAYASNVASNWIATTVEGAKDAASAYGGNLAGDVVIAGGNLVENAGRTVGNSVANYMGRYGNWVTGHGDKLRGVPPSAMPKSGPLAQYKAGGVGAGTLKRSASYGPSTSSAKALTKTATAKASTIKPKTLDPTTAVKPYATHIAGALEEPKKRKKKPKKQPEEEETPLSQKGNSKYPTSSTGARTGAKPSVKPNLPKGAPSLKRVSSFPPANNNPNFRASIVPPKTTNNKVSSDPKARASTRPGGGSAPSEPKKSPTYGKSTDKPQAPANKASAGGYVPNGGFSGRDKEKDAGGAKGYKPYTAPSKGPEKQGGGANKTGGGYGGGHIPIPGGAGGGDNKSKDYKPYTPPSKGPSGGGAAGGDSGAKDAKLDRTFF